MGFILRMNRLIFFILIIFCFLFAGCSEEKVETSSTTDVFTATPLVTSEPTPDIVTSIPVTPVVSVTPEPQISDNDSGFVFDSVNESVTAKEETNLRNKPSQGDDSEIGYVLKNGEVVKRVGVSNSGWSKIEFNGKIYYAVSSLLTTDLSYKPPVDDGIKTVFTEVNEMVTAKEAVNLRKKPSVNDEIAPVVVQIKNGDVVHRNGINKDVGWSRVEYNGQTLYCISSYLMLAEN